MSLLTRGSPAQVTGGHLYHRRMAEAAAVRGVRLDVISTGLGNPLRGARGVVLVDSLAAWSVAPWVVAGGGRQRPLAAILHQPPGGVGQGTLRTILQRPLDNVLYRRCDLLIAASAALARDLVEDFGFPAERITTVEPGSDLPPASPASPASGVVGDLRRGRRIAVICVANWLANKAIVELLEAVAALADDDLTLHLVGRTDADARYAARVRERASARDLVDRVVVHGPVTRERLAGLYAGADVFALASYAETYGTVFAEALTAGLPTVGTRTGNLPNLIADGVEGCLVDAGDVTALSRALHRLATDDAWRASLGRAALRRGATLNTWNDTADAFFEALRRLA